MSSPVTAGSPSNEKPGSGCHPAREFDGDRTRGAGGEVEVQLAAGEGERLGDHLAAVVAGVERGEAIGAHRQPLKVARPSVRTGAPHTSTSPRPGRHDATRGII